MTDGDPWSAYESLCGELTRTTILGLLHNSYNLFLAHLSRRLKGELLVYRGIRRPSVVRPSSTFSNDVFSEAAGPILLIFHTVRLPVPGNFYSCVVSKYLLRENEISFLLL